MARRNDELLEMESDRSIRPMLSPSHSSFEMLETPNYKFDTLNYNAKTASEGSDVDVDEIRGSTYRNSEISAQAPRLSTASTNQGSVFIRGSLMDRGIDAAPQDSKRQERPRDYKGRIRTWPGLIFLLLILGAAGFAVAYFAINKQDSSSKRAMAFQKAKYEQKIVRGGRNPTTNKDDIISDDGVIGNPKFYPRSVCELPNYVSRNGRIVAVSANGTEVPLQIKGVNWFGMETGQAAPLGLWDNNDNGTTAYMLAKFLGDNNFNAVRLPLMATWILENKKPNVDIINVQENRGISVANYMSLIKGVVKALQYRGIGILLSMHTLTLKDNGALWYNADVSEEKFLESIDILTKNLCKQEYWNIMGIDLKNEPFKGTWGDGGKTDFREGSLRIANRMLEGCDKWMGFVEGVNGQRSVTIDGEEFGYYDWYGGGLQGAKKVGLEFAVKDKVVWAPHYYTPAVFPQRYLFGAGTKGPDDILEGYVELEDDALRHRIKVTMDDMFGFLYSESGPALLLGEFGGLYAEDKHKMKTTKRCTDFTIEIIKKWAGGFMWSLNPESEYQFNPADTRGQFHEGLLNMDWLSTNVEFLTGMEAMDDMPDLKRFPCFPTPETASDDSSSSGSS
ncbi:TPA: hypothetical protein N0F65_006184 [Lagenidium giganteum]|uniref:Glycoside hydrolase family 5 domain-containing protein n=1 Tax=Lagenidium giganteum TaxID=4803 RepID=A0AAV2ZAA0_9STRA|nr:TPA: hypothetical protein N0F65_006184 [Lagenidium giganteum]